MSVLAEILSAKRDEVAHRSRVTPLHELDARIADLGPARPFVERLRSSPGVSLIAEIKKASPSRGVIREQFDPPSLARDYELGGAACLSVLTDERWFQGRLDFIEQVRGASALPVLRKDFVVDAWQIAEARAAGADAVLLIVAAMDRDTLERLLAAAAAYGMAALVEVHTEAEAAVAAAVGAAVIGINNRDLHTFTTDLAVTERVASELGASNITLVSESGIFEPGDVQRVAAAGCKAVLVGEALMRVHDVAAAARRLMGAAA